MGSTVAKQMERYLEEVLDGVNKDFSTNKGNPLRVVEEKATQETIEKYLPTFEKMVLRYTNQMLEGKLKPHRWGTFVEYELLQLYLTAAAVAVGGAGRMKPDDIRAIDAKMKEQHKYLVSFVRTLEKLPLEGFNQGYIINRIMLYPNSSAEVMYRLRDRDASRPELPFYPRDGKTLCIIHCRCEWEWREVDSTEGNWDVYYRIDHDFENCATCLARAEACSPLEIRNGKITTRLNMSRLIYEH